jgi:hypothetical protein
MSNVLRLSQPVEGDPLEEILADRFLREVGLGHLGDRPSGGYAVHRDPMPRPLRGQVFRQGDDPPFFSIFETKSASQMKIF